MLKREGPCGTLDTSSGRATRKARQNACIRVDAGAVALLRAPPYALGALRRVWDTANGNWRKTGKPGLDVPRWVRFPGILLRAKPRSGCPVEN
ncbi:hypothetical protein OPTIMUS_181 [Mycobacterium phage Optimus]|uniref:Uncharacterized protein n=2 Tax=Omegavirus TaxID=1623292 RepID=G1DAX0_9CAUD|nr:hypothetical protein N857_gp180 [Mycobacterium phage Wanda]YP_009124136.1 hypothetical protein VC71_gp183 [Mycobacterium phage Minerva]YP_009591037.1 hypothetical protein FDG54_gp181 [Mycobacterium phage Optimus]YP_009636360.1 hypothetical protein FGG20_gp189 [Mycobacterium phage Baka]ATN89962.1 hypothetical protein SEA_KLEIN_187 [Mycobacterium phage Klein]AYB69667.1 hypothetical protein SEA_KALAH2_180 [Mycobacterium phage Kalah2]QDP43989.1 hypothetical protein SEA_DALLAS_183 [Mycobacteriu